MNKEFLARLSSAIRDATHRPTDIVRATPVGGGNINHAYRIDTQDGIPYFLKLNDARYLAMFATESAGLATLAAIRALRVPRPIVHGVITQHSFLVMEHFALQSDGDARLLGEQLAALHRHTSPQFGFSTDNFIGSSRQPNPWTDDWFTFWRDQRLRFQLQLATRNGLGSVLQSLGAQLSDALPLFFAGYSPHPSLLHGDLWGGNHAYIAGGIPAIFDPACYFGDRECDLAMTELFGGFPADFYQAYRAAWPLDAGYSARRDLYNLYHILNHANLFGGSYVRQAELMIKTLLERAR